MPAQPAFRSLVGAAADVRRGPAFGLQRGRDIMPGAAAERPRRLCPGLRTSVRWRRWVGAGPPGATAGDDRYRSDSWAVLCLDGHDAVAADDLPGRRTQPPVTAGSRCKLGAPRCHRPKACRHTTQTIWVPSCTQARVKVLYARRSDVRLAAGGEGEAPRDLSLTSVHFYETVE